MPHPHSVNERGDCAPWCHQCEVEKMERKLTERAEAAEQRLKACEAAHGETKRQLQEARAGDIGPYSDQLVLQLGELRDAVEGLRVATLAHDRAVLLLLECRALLERARALYDPGEEERGRRHSLWTEVDAMLVQLRKVKAWPPVKG